MEPVVAALLDELPAESVVVDPDVADQYRFDRALTIHPGVPSVVVRPASTDEVATTVRLADRFGVGVVTRGAGTGLSGGSAAVDGTITLSMDRMRSVSIDRAAMTATVQPGVLNVEVKQAARADGLWYPPDPSSFEICSIGGNLATNAGGLCCVKYGVTTDYVLGLEVVLADGTVVRLGGSTIKDVAGLDLKRLFVGSEGTLGVITAATLQLRPIPPTPSTVVATFDDPVAAGRTVSEVMGATRPATLELMDRASVAAVESVKPMGLDPGIGALLLGQSDSGADVTDHIAEIATGHGATYVALTDDADEGEMLMAARRMAIPCMERLGSVLIEDVGVPIPRIADLLVAVEGVAERNDTRIPVIGHAGDGNFHPLVTYDASDPEATRRAETAFGEVMDAALELGGTITGEHGVGSLKARHLAQQLGPDVMALAGRVKQALDPKGTFNPGKWI
ncbi:MAG TPA: FAD-linked oxidase C-terminal domain-containing protein [Acidimicrobiales bacterium]|nr:FAD-linked oxidase C-terminal domain-containing protein [Acidimicrobiales bacterium]